MAPMTMANTTFLILSDTHNFETDTAPDGCPLGQAMPKVDVVLHCGDLTQVGGISAYKKAVRLLGQLDAELKLVIAGNHDLSLDGKYWAENLDEEAGDELEEHDQAVEIMTGHPAKANGVTYLTEGTHTFTLKNGVTFTIYASPYQPAFGDWAFGYKRTEDRFNIDVPVGTTSIAEHPIPDNVDIVMTHGPPRGILDGVPSREHAEIEHLGCDAILRAVDRSRPLLHCFGHLHEGYGAEIKRWDAASQEKRVKTQHGGRTKSLQTVNVSQAGVSDNAPKAFKLTPGYDTLMVNAAIMDDRNKPVNAPWLVELKLPRA